MFDINQFRADILGPALDGLQIREPGWSELLVFTCAVESAGGTYVRQINGPALGIYQIEPTTFTDLWFNFIIRKPDIVNMLSLNLNLHRLPSPSEIITNLTLASAFCILYYKFKKAPVPVIEGNTEDNLWEIYKEYYNTPEGASEKDKSIKAYRKFIKIGN